VRLLTIAVVLVLALAGASCGGDDEASSDGDDVTIETTTDETTTDDTTTDETTDDDTGDLDELASGECQELVAASTSFSEAFGAAGQDGDVDDVSELFEEFADRAPEEIRDDFAILAEAYASYAEVIGDVQIEPGETPDAEALARLQEALASIDQAEVTAASQRISDWATENC